MIGEYTPRMRALKRIAATLAQHQPVRREYGVGSSCRNRTCYGLTFLNRNDLYNHQSVVLANDLHAEADCYLQNLRDEAEAEAREVTAEELAYARSTFLVLTPAPETPVSGKDPR